MLCVVLDNINLLVQGDDSLGEIKKKSLKTMREKKTEAEYLAAVWVLTVCMSTDCQNRMSLKGTGTKADGILEGAQETASYEDPTDAVITGQSCDDHIYRQNKHLNNGRHILARQLKFTKTISTASVSIAQLLILCIIVSIISVMLTAKVFLPDAVSLSAHSADETPNEGTPDEESLDEETPIVESSEKIEALEGSAISSEGADITGVIENSDKIAICIPLYRTAYIDVGDSDGYTIYGNDANNKIRIITKTGTSNGAGRTNYNNYATFSLNWKATRFSATFNPPTHSYFEPELTYRVFCDGKPYSVTLMNCDSEPILIDLDVSGVDEIMIVTDLVSKNSSLCFTDSDYMGIQNATIITMDY